MKIQAKAVFSPIIQQSLVADATSSAAPAIDTAAMPSSSSLRGRTQSAAAAGSPLRHVAVAQLRQRVASVPEARDITHKRRGLSLGGEHYHK
jgi:hypothetical protein